MTYLDAEAIVAFSCHYEAANGAAGPTPNWLRQPVLLCKVASRSSRACETRCMEPPELSIGNGRPGSCVP